MPKFVCSYAHDIGCFVDFVVEADTKEAALLKIQHAMREGRFENVETEPAWENGITNERVFVQGPVRPSSVVTTLDELVGGEHLFSPATNVCVRCGISVDDDAVENTPCRI